MLHPHFFRLFFGNRNALADTMRLVSALAVEKELEDARAREKADPYNPGDYNKKADEPYKKEVYRG